MYSVGKRDNLGFNGSWFPEVTAVGAAKLDSRRPAQRQALPPRRGSAEAVPLTQRDTSGGVSTALPSGSMFVKNYRFHLLPHQLTLEAKFSLFPNSTQSNR